MADAAVESLLENLLIFVVFHIWNSEIEELVFTSSKTFSFHIVEDFLTEITDLIGRVRVTSHETAVACTSLNVIVFDLHNQGLVLREEDFAAGIIKGCFDSNDEAALIIDIRGTASLRRLADLEEVFTLRVRGVAQAQQRGRILGNVNGGYGVVITARVIKVWEIERGEFLHSFRLRCIIL